MDVPPSPTWTRRRWLRVASTAGAAAAFACAAETEDEPAPTVELAADALAPGERRVVRLGRLPVELRRAGEGVVATALRCTHQGCAVTWKPGAERYECGCHGGVFDAEGHPTAGPPRTVGDRLVVRRPG